MEKIKNFIKNYSFEILFTILFLGLFFFSFLNYATIPTSDGVGVNLNLFELYSGINVTVNSEIYSLKSASIPFILGLIFYLISFVLVVINSFIKDKRKIQYILYIVSLILLVIFGFIYVLGGLLIPVIAGVPVGDSNLGTTNLGFGIYLIVFLIFMGILLFSKILERNQYSIKELCETAILVAVAVVLDQFAKIPVQANGGSISLSAVPLFIIAIRYGAFKGFMASSLFFGFITCLADGYGIQTYPFDYFVALSGYGIIGLFYNLNTKYFEKHTEKQNKLKIPGYIISLIISGIIIMIIRYIGHIISGLILYPTMSLLDNFIYQSTYVPLSVWTSIGVTIFLLGPIMYINKIYPVKKKEMLKVENNQNE